MTENKLLIIGGGGYASVVAELAELLKLQIVGFADDSKKIGTKIYKNKEVLCTTWNLDKIEFDFFIVAIGNNEVRKQLFEKHIDEYNSINLIHPSSVITENRKFGIGNVVLPGAILMTNCVIGNNNLINAMTMIDHDTEIENHCHLRPGTTIGSNCFISNMTETSIGENVKALSSL